jgi:alpha-beta hydrolase superfamily lysophospholipase
MVTFSIQRLARDDGASVAFYTWPAPAQPIKAAVQLAHGLAEHAGRYDRFALALVHAGYAVFASDHRGHGQTVQDRTELGHLPAPRGFQRVVDDLYAVNRRIAAEHPNVPRVLFGHSFGSFVAQQYMGTYGDSLAAAVLSGTNSGVGPLAKVGTVIATLERLRLGATATSALLQKMSFGSYNKAFAPTRTEDDWLSRDPAEVDKYVADPLCGFAATTETWVELTRALTRIEDPAFQARVPKALPVYLFAGDLDPVGRAGRGPKKLSRAYTRAGLKDVTLKLYPGARHELLNEINRDEVTSDVIAWLDSHVARATR